MLIPQVTAKIAIKTGLHSWGWELYCSTHAPENDTYPIDTADYKRMEDDKDRFYGCLECCKTVYYVTSFLQPTPEEIN